MLSHITARSHLHGAVFFDDSFWVSDTFHLRRLALVARCYRPARLAFVSRNSGRRLAPGHRCFVQVYGSFTCYGAVTDFDSINYHDTIQRRGSFVILDTIACFGSFIGLDANHRRRLVPHPRHTFRDQLAPPLRRAPSDATQSVLTVRISSFASLRSVRHSHVVGLTPLPPVLSYHPVRSLALGHSPRLRLALFMRYYRVPRLVQKFRHSPSFRLTPSSAVLSHGSVRSSVAMLSLRAAYLYARSFWISISALASSFDSSATRSM